MTGNWCMKGRRWCDRELVYEGEENGVLINAFSVYFV